MVKITTDNYIDWIYTNAVDFESKKNENYYKNNQRVEDDLTKAEQIIINKAPANKKESAVNGWETIRDNIIKPDLKDQVKDLNEEETTKIREATDLQALDKLGVDDNIDIYEKSTRNTFNSNRGVFIKQEKINLREERSVVLSEYEEMKRQELGRGLTASEMREAEEQAVAEGKIISRDEYLQKRNEM